MSTIFTRRAEPMLKLITRGLINYKDLPKIMGLSDKEVMRSLNHLFAQGHVFFENTGGNVSDIKNFRISGEGLERGYGNN